MGGGIEVHPIQILMCPLSYKIAKIETYSEIAKLQKGVISENGY